MTIERPKTKVQPSVLRLDNGLYLGVVLVSVGYLGLRGQPFEETVPSGPAPTEDEALAAAEAHADVVRGRYAKLVV